MRRASLAVVVALILAGCTSTDSSPSDAAESLLGTLQGVVVDSAIRPLPETMVRLTPGDREAVAGADGKFTFENVPPGQYALKANRTGYLSSSLTVQVDAGRTDSTVRVTLEFIPSTLRFANVYKFTGFYECGAWPTNGCANINIVTGIILCQFQLPCFDATGDKSIFLQSVDPGMDFLQTEMVWTPSLDAGRSLLFVAGGASDAELQQGIAPAYNSTSGESPLYLTLSKAVLEEGKIGTDRKLLVQVGSGADDLVPGGCVVANPCGPGVHFQQKFEIFTTTYYGYIPDPAWRFSETGRPDPPPP